MPTISRFFGIVIRMYFDEHTPPHFHAYYNDDSASIRIDTLEVLRGKLNRRAMAMVLEWAAEHREELYNNWWAAQKHENLEYIDPLK